MTGWCRQSFFDVIAGTVAPEITLNSQRRNANSKEDTLVNSVGQSPPDLLFIQHSPQTNEDEPSRIPQYANKADSWNNKNKVPHWKSKGGMKQSLRKQRQHTARRCQCSKKTLLTSIQLGD